MRKFCTATAPRARDRPRSRGRAIGAIVEVLERANRRSSAGCTSSTGVPFLVPEDPRIAHDILVPTASGQGEGRAGRHVDIIPQPAHAQPIGRVAEVLGHHADPGMEIEIAVRKFDLPHEFSRKAWPRSRGRTASIPQDASRDGKTCASSNFVTIDGETARDFDDAVAWRAEGGGWRLSVAIADVSHYVQPGDALDLEARERGTSVYFPSRVIPMLPEKLSNGLCSLNPNVDRLAMVCEMAITPQGEVVRYEFYDGVIRSHARLTYTEVAGKLPPARAPPREAARRCTSCSMR